MFDPFERYIQFHQLYLDTQPKEAPAVDITLLIPKIIERIDKNESSQTISNGDAVISIADHHWDKKNNLLILLFHNSNFKATDPAFKNTETGAVRIEEKRENEGVAVSAHVAISLSPTDELGRQFDFLLESITGLARSTVMPFLRKEIKVVCKELGLDEFHDKDSKKNKKVQILAEINAEPSKEFMDEIKNNSDSITGFELVKYDREDVFDEDGYYVENITRTFLKKRKPFNHSITDIIKSIKNVAKKKDYDLVKIKYKHDQKARTASLNTTNQDIKDILVTREEKISTQVPILQCEKTILDSFKRKMTALVKDLKVKGHTTS